METALLVVAILTLIGFVVVAIDMATGARFVLFVDHVTRPSREELAVYPRVSVIVPARNEEQHLAAAMLSLIHI